MIVVDTNIICYQWMKFNLAEEVERALTKDPDWIVPFLWRSEFRNALAGALRTKAVNLAAALKIARTAERQFRGREFFVSSDAILALVAMSKSSAYDCEFVALAQERQVPLLTVDRGLLRDFPGTAISLSEFCKA